MWDVPFALPKAALGAGIETAEVLVFAASEA